MTVDSALTSKSVFRVRPGYRIYKMGRVGGRDTHTIDLVGEAGGRRGTGLEQKGN